MRRISFTVPGNPVPWKRARRGLHGSYTDPAASTHMEAVRLAARIAGWRGALAVPFRLTCRFYRDLAPSHPHFGDRDNLEKLIKDALNGIVWVDDRFVTTVGEGGKIRDPDARTEVEIEVLEAQRVTGEAAVLHDMLTKPGPAKRERTNASRLRSSVRRP